MYYYFLMDLSKERILITGGCGYIGSHTSLLLLEMGYSIVIVDSNINSSPKIIDKIHQIALNKNISIKQSNNKFILSDTCIIFTKWASDFLVNYDV